MLPACDRRYSPCWVLIISTCPSAKSAQLDPARPAAGVKTSSLSSRPARKPDGRLPGQGAVGLWQFILATGKVYGPQANRSDRAKRRDPIKSTRAAARYPSRPAGYLYHGWNLATCGFTIAGPGTINKAIRDVREEPKDSRKLYKLSAPGGSWIQCAGHFYRCKLSSRPIIVSITSAHWKWECRKERVPYTYLVHSQPQQIAAVYNSNIDELRALNPGWQDIIPGNEKPYALRLSNKMMMFPSRDSIYNYKPEVYQTRRSKVK